MITMKFIQGWNDALLSNSPRTSSNDTYEYPTEKPFISELIARINTSSSTTEVLLVQKIIEKIIRSFDTSDTLYGLFQIMSQSGVSPFIATHDYCVKVFSCDRFGHVKMNISPIYHLGLEYPDNYKRQHDKDLDQEAIIGLLETPVVGTLPPGHTAYSYGIDAGVLFKNSKISHNKALELRMEEIPEGLLATLNCNGQTTSSTLSWESIGLRAIHTFEVREQSGTKVLPLSDYQ